MKLSEAQQAEYDDENTSFTYRGELWVKEEPDHGASFALLNDLLEYASGRHPTDRIIIFKNGKKYAKYKPEFVLRIPPKLTILEETDSGTAETS